MKGCIYKFLLTSFFLFSLYQTSIAMELLDEDSEEISIDGVISDQYGKPLRNVSVVLYNNLWGNPDLAQMVTSTVTDSDGVYSITYVPTSIERDRSRESLSTFELGSAYPNPVRRESGSIPGQTHLPVRVSTGENYQIEVFSIDGRLIQRSSNILSPGIHTVSIGLPQTAGVYLVRVRGNKVNQMRSVTSLGGGSGISIDVRSGALIPQHQEFATESVSVATTSDSYILRVDGGVYYDDYEVGFPSGGQFNHDVTLESLLGPEEPWLAEARDRIEQHRKADIEINVTDLGGIPIPDAKVEVNMTRHDFGFGALMGEARFEDRPNPTDARIHREVQEEKFNKVVVGAHKTDTFIEMIDWMAERDIRVRGHYLMWARYQPGEGRRGQLQEVPDDLEEVRQYALDYIEEMINYAGVRVHEWDLVNHIVTDVGGHTGYDHMFGEDFFAEVFEFAREIAPPGVEMWVNEGFILRGTGGRADHYYSQIERLIQYGQPPDGIGFMAHFRGDDIATMPEIYERLDRFAELVPNLQLTEYDINYDDRQFQARYMHDVMYIVFSHPAVSGVVQWQIWGGSGDNQHLFDVDWTIRPHGEVYFDLVYNHWWTNEDGHTNNDGAYSTRGFQGDYEVTVQVGDEIKTVEAHLGSDGLTLDISF